MYEVLSYNYRIVFSYEDKMTNRAIWALKLINSKWEITGKKKKKQTKLRSLVLSPKGCIPKK